MKNKLPFIYDEWNKWTSNSNNIPFKSTEKSIGDGEQKLGKEFDTKPLGQNSSYDLYLFNIEWEVKKLDSDNSFRIGVGVSSHYTPIISSVIRIFEKIEFIYPNLVESETKQSFQKLINKITEKTGRSKTLLLEGLRKNEVSSSNLNKANEIIEELKSCLLFNNDQKIRLFSAIDGIEREYNLEKAFVKIDIEDISISEKVKIIGSEDDYNKLLIFNEIKKDLYIFKNTSLRDLLNKIVRDIFTETQLILVHETHGFQPIKNLNRIFCNRITSGNPRCKVLKIK